jgi:hypothetical protein
MNGRNFISPLFDCETFMNTALFPPRPANERRSTDCDDLAARFRMCQDEFDDDHGPENRWLDSHDWDEFDDDEFDPEPSNEELGDDFNLDQIPDETQRPPEELWNDADWE